MAVDQERSVQRHVLEVIEGPEALERRQRLVRQQREREAILALALRERLLQSLRRIRADGHERNSRFSKVLGRRSEGVELFQAMHAAVAEIKQHDDGLATVLLERNLFPS